MCSQTLEDLNFEDPAMIYLRAVKSSLGQMS